MRRAGPAVIVVGGFAGTGKTTIARRLSLEWNLPRLGSDTIGRTIRASRGLPDDAVDAYRIAYDVLFALCEEFVQAHVSVILDLTLGWAFQWQQLDLIRQGHPETSILRCPPAIRYERTRQRHTADPAQYDPPEMYTTDPRLIQVAAFLEHLDRPDAHFIDASSAPDDVYQEVTRYLELRLTPQPDQQRGAYHNRLTT